MQWQGQPARSVLARGQQQAVATEIVETDMLSPERIEHPLETAFGEELAGQEMMALQGRIMLAGPAPVNRRERQARQAMPIRTPIPADHPPLARPCVDQRIARIGGQDQFGATVGVKAQFPGKPLSSDQPVRQPDREAHRG